MIKLIKFVFNLVLALVAVALTLVIIFFLTPSWQKGAVERILEGDAARQWQVGALRLQPLGVEAEGLFVLDGAVGAEVRFLEMDGPLWKVPFTGKLEIESGTIAGIDMDLTQVRVGDLTSEDYQGFLQRVAGDPAFWEERVGLVLSKLSAAGLEVHLQDVKVTGMLRMPGDAVVPVNWVILEADSHAPRMIKVERRKETGKVL